MINCTEDHRDSASDGHFGPPVTETCDKQLEEKFRDLGKNKYHFRGFVSKFPDQKQRQLGKTTKQKSSMFTKMINPDP